MSSAPGAADFNRGQKVGKYEILTRLSVGGMAELFLAFTAGPGGFRKFVALKTILPDIKKDESFVKMFLDEARITAALSHANIGQVYDLGIEAGELYLAMEFISGLNLEQVQKTLAKKGEKMPLGFACAAIRDSAMALHYAHNFVDPAGKPSPVVHRDVSPKNVMVTYQGAVKVIDFGIAKAKGRLNRTQVGMVKGTSGYMSPEQVRGQPLDGRSDLFSVGVMLFEFLTGQRLFNLPSDAAMMMAIADANIPDPRSINPEIPKPLADVVMKALAREKEERFATGKELAKAVEAAASKLLFDEEQNAEFIQKLFAEKMEKTRQLLEIASRPVEADEALLNEVAGAIASEEGDKTPAPKKAVTPPRASNRTPAPRMKPDDATLPPTSRTPRSLDATLPPTSKTPPKPPVSAKNRFKSEVAESYAIYDQAESETEQTVTKPPKKPQVTAKAPEPDPAEEETTDPRAGGRSTAVRPKIPTRRDAQKSGGGGAFKWILLLLVIGGAVGSYFAPGKVGDFSRGLVGHARGYVDKEMAGEPPPPPTQKLEEANPALLALKQKQELEAKQAEEEKKRAELAQAQLEQMNAQKDAGVDVAAADPKKTPEKKKTSETKVVTAKVASTETKAATAKTAEKASDKTSEKTAEKQKPSDDAALNPDEVQVLDTRNSRTAKEDGVGWLTLYTVPPAAVFDGDTQLGTTPLTKVPFPVGVYKLKVMDPDGTERVLSAPIKAGEVTSMKLRVADLPAAK